VEEACGQRKAHVAQVAQDVDMDRERLRRLARGQFGVFSRAQARACGFTNYQIRRRLQAGDWQPVLGAGLAVAGYPITACARDRAAQLSVPGSVRSAHSRRRAPGSCPFPRKGRSWSSVRMGGPGLTASTCNTAIRRSGMSTGFKACRHSPDRALQAGWIAVEDLVRRVRSRLGEHGTPRLLELLGGVVGGERSAAERVLTELLRDGGVTGWTANAEIHDGTGLIGVADVAFRRRGWSSRSTGSRTTSRRTVSNATAGGRTGSWRLAGPSCGSPGVT
jgi:hypothetical protein